MRGTTRFRMNERDWDKVADSFEQEIFNVPANDTKGIILDWVERLAVPEAVATDLGCGVGRTLPMLAERYAKVYAVDVSSQCLEVAAKANTAHDNIEYVHADVSEDKNSYPATDVVLCINTWLNASLEIRTGLVDRTLRGVKKDGHLLLVVPSLNSTLLTAYRHLQWNLRDGMDPREAQKAAALNGRGWSTASCISMGCPPSTTCARNSKHYSSTVASRCSISTRSSTRGPPNSTRRPNG
ncbi:MAG: class I SAM-dependent methyltransferase [Flavobacteriales bacterium]|nr:class I SAM-dependent methyltransferase [Flavobacteriales bacterium]